MSQVIMKADGTPFEDKKAAQMRAGVLRKDGVETDVVEVDGGFSLKVVAKERKKRVPLTKRNVLTTRDKDKGYEYRFVNDVEDRISLFEEAGWEIVKGQKVGDQRAGSDSPVGSATTKAVGGGKIAVPMKKKKEWYEEEYAQKQSVNDKSEEGLIAHAAQGRYGKLQINKSKFDGELK